MNLKIEQLKSRLEKLEACIDGKKVFRDHELLAWIAASVAFLSEVGVNNEIINGFMRTFEFKRLGDLGEKPRIGPFVYNYDFDNKDGELGYKLESNSLFFGDNKPSRDIFYIRVAFTAAKAKLNREQEEERITPRFLIDSLSQDSKYSHVVSSLELIEQAYKDKSPDGLVKNSTTLLDSILDLDGTLKAKEEVSKKLRVLMTDRGIREKFGVERELIFALNNSRLIRNLRSVHKDRPLKYDIPFIVAVSCAYLVVVLLENTLSHGELITI